MCVLISFIYLAACRLKVYGSSSAAAEAAAVAFLYNLTYPDPDRPGRSSRAPNTPKEKTKERTQRKEQRGSARLMGPRNRNQRKDKEMVQSRGVCPLLLLRGPSLDSRGPVASRALGHVPSLSISRGVRYITRWARGQHGWMD